MELIFGREKQPLIKTVCSIILKLAIVGCVVGGVVSSELSSAFMGGGTTFLYFTIQSNVWIGAISLAFVVFQIMGIANKKNCIPNWLYTVKFMFVTSITLTFTVMACMLTPTMIMQGYASYLVTPSNVLCHYAVPLMAILDFILFDTDWKNGWTDSFFAVIMPIYYLVFALVAGHKGVAFDTSGATYPYFFLDVEAMGWFSVSNPDGKYGAFTFGVFWWIIILTIFVIAMGFAFMAINRGMKKTKLAKAKL